MKLSKSKDVKVAIKQLYGQCETHNRSLNLKIIHLYYIQFLQTYYVVNTKMAQHT